MRSNGSSGSATRYALTHRETEILGLMLLGKTDREIARTLSLGRRTVSNHVSNVLLKMNAKTRTEAAVRAVVLGVVSPPQQEI